MAALYGYLCPALPAHRPIELSVPLLLLTNPGYHYIKRQPTGNIQKRSEDNGDGTSYHQIF